MSDRQVATRGYVDERVGEVGDALGRHVADRVAHVTQEERDLWDSAAERLSTHESDTVAHVTQEKRDLWDSAAERLSTHESDTVAHVTQADRNRWDSAAEHEDGKSAYQIALDHGFVGDEAAWLISLNGKSAYEIAVENGYTGTEAEWLASIHGTNGKSAYEIAVEHGFPTEPPLGGIDAWLASLHGTNGKSAYEIAVDEGFSGSVSQWLQSLKGTGTDPTEVRLIISRTLSGTVFTRSDVGYKNAIEAIAGALGARFVDSGRTVYDAVTGSVYVTPAPVFDIDTGEDSIGGSEFDDSTGMLRIE